MCSRVPSNKKFIKLLTVVLVMSVNVDTVISELAEVFKVPPPTYDYDTSKCGGALACFDPSTYTMHLTSPILPPGVVAHEMGHAAHTYYQIPGGEKEYETFAQFTEQLYEGWKTYKYGGNVKPTMLNPPVLGCSNCGNYTVPHIYPYTQCVSCGTAYGYGESVSSSSSSSTCQPNVPLALVIGTLGGMVVSGLTGYMPPKNREDADRIIEITLTSNFLTVLTTLLTGGL